MLHKGISALAVAACGLALCACGSSGGSSTASAGVSPAVEFSQCMRAHGVSNFPDPGSGGSIQIGPSSGIDPRSPTFQAAQRACGRYAPFKSLPRMSGAQARAALAFAECMRAHGQPDFPDPMRTAPAGATRVLVLRGMVFAPGPGLDPRSPAFRRAATACGITPPH